MSLGVDGNFVCFGLFFLPSVIDTFRFNCPTALCFIILSLLFFCNVYWYWFDSLFFYLDLLFYISHMFCFIFHCIFSLVYYFCFNSLLLPRSLLFLSLSLFSNLFLFPQNALLVCVCVFASSLLFVHFHYHNLGCFSHYFHFYAAFFRLFVLVKVPAP